MLSVDDVNAILRLPILGILADEPDVIVSTNKGEPVALDAGSRIGIAYRDIAARLAGDKVAAPVPPAERTFFERLTEMFTGRKA